VSTILVTGADGFIGRRLCLVLQNRGAVVRRAVRIEPSPRGVNTFATGDLAKFVGWRELAGGVDCVVHLAGRAHVTSKHSPNDVASYRPVNVDATLRLAEAAVAEGVKRFVFVSSIGVNGNQTRGAPFTEAKLPAPVDAYAISKWEAEMALTRLLAGSGTGLVIVRPPLVYGPGVKGNLLRLMKIVATGLPVPLGSLHAPRNIIGSENLCDLLMACLEHPAAAGEVFLAAESESQSTATLLEAIAARMSPPGRVWRCPLPLVHVAAALAGRSTELAKLSRPLEVDAGKALNVLGWRPVLPFADGIAATVDRFQLDRRRDR
jgi:nucleoside-diphosphate-sugar epimerase